MDFYRTLTTCPYDRLRKLALNLDMPLDSLVQAMIPGRDGKGERWMDVERGILSAEQFWEEACAFAYEQCGIQADPGQVMKQFISVEVPDVILEILGTLRTQGWRVCIVTNGFRPANGMHPSLDLVSSMVTTVVESQRVGLRKPDPEIFDLALTELNCPREQALYIDDTEWFVAQARKQGLYSICVSQVEDTATILRMIC